MKRYFNNEVICYNATDDENAEDMTGHGTQMALLIVSNSKQKNQFMALMPMFKFILLKFVIH